MIKDIKVIPVEHHASSPEAITDDAIRTTLTDDTLVSKVRDALNSNSEVLLHHKAVGSSQATSGTSHVQAVRITPPESLHQQVNAEQVKALLGDQEHVSKVHGMLAASGEAISHPMTKHF